MAQLVARLLWEQDAAGSSPVTSTKRLRELISGPFSLLIAVRFLRADRLISVSPHCYNPLENLEFVCGS